MKSNAVLGQQDMVGVEHWDTVWQQYTRALYRPIAQSWTCMAARQRDFFFQYVPRGARLIEIGCGGSLWLPFFGRHLGCKVWGIDYSADGVRLCQEYLACEDVQGNIILGNLFDTLDIPLDYFDVVWSAGFIEHFQDISAVVERLSQYARPGGKIITSVPNLDGLIGWLHQIADPELYSQHVVIDPVVLDTVHSQSGLRIVRPASYFGVFALTVVNFNRWRGKLPSLIDRSIWRGVKVFQELVCFPARLSRAKAETRLFSPYVLGVYER